MDQKKLNIDSGQAPFGLAVFGLKTVGVLVFGLLAQDCKSWIMVGFKIYDLCIRVERFL